MPIRKTPLRVFFAHVGLAPYSDLSNQSSESKLSSACFAMPLHGLMLLSHVEVYSICCCLHFCVNVSTVDVV
ncbi:MAG: hypothetical protein K2K07_09100, partial [Lachnospiraceae bacterium]|nr:hypothetical protein [Lachnospiraceae bacterium]